MQNIDAKTAKDWLDKDEAVLIDVREPGEYAAEHIPQALHQPLGGVCVAQLPDLPGKKVIMHCQKGKRGSSACEKLLNEKPDLEIYNLEGGLDAWKQAELPVITSKGFFLPLDRQVQLTIGLGVLLGVALGYGAHSGFFLLSAFFGLGLTFAGLSGWCGLALLMAKMPWNRQSTTICPTGGSQ